MAHEVGHVVARHTTNQIALMLRGRDLIALGQLGWLLRSDLIGIKSVRLIDLVGIRTWRTGKSQSSRTCHWIAAIMQGYRALYREAHLLLDDLAIRRQPAHASSS